MAVVVAVVVRGQTQLRPKSPNLALIVRLFQSPPWRACARSFERGWTSPGPWEGLAYSPAFGVDRIFFSARRANGFTQVLVHVSTYQGSILGTGFLSHSQMGLSQNGLAWVASGSSNQPQKGARASNKGHPNVLNWVSLGTSWSGWV